MKRFKRKPKEKIPNLRSKRKKAEEIDGIQRGVLVIIQFYVFVLAIAILYIASIGNK